MNEALEQKVEERTRDLACMVVDLEKLNQELQQLDQLKSDFVTLVSHELRAPLTNIRSGVELILETGESVPGRHSRDPHPGQDRDGAAEPFCRNHSRSVGLGSRPLSDHTCGRSLWPK